MSRIHAGETRATMHAMVEAFELQMARLLARSLDPTTRSDVAALRAAWSRFVDFLAPSPMERLRICSACSRSQFVVGLRCAFCWHKLDHAPTRDPELRP